MEKTLPKAMVFSLVFFNGFGAVWDLFWEGFGALLASLGSLLAMFLMSVCQSLAKKGSRRVSGWIWAHFHDFYRLLELVFRVFGWLQGWKK